MKTAVLGDVSTINPSLIGGLETDDEVAFLPMAGVSELNIDARPTETRQAADVKTGYTYFQDGDVLLAKITPCFENGKIAIAQLKHRHGFGSTEFHVVRATPGRLDGRYLVHFLRQDRLRLEGERRMTGSAGQRRIPRNFIENLLIPLPPLPEQRRIAAILDAADALRQKRRQSLRLLDQLSQSIFIDMFGDPLTNVEGRPRTTLGHIAKFVGGGTPSRAVPEYFTGDICWATSKDIKAEVLIGTQEHVTEKAITESATNLVEPGTILVVVKSKILMRRLPVTITQVPVCFGQDLKGIRVPDEWPSAFIARQLIVGQKFLLEKARGANTEGLTLDHLRDFPIVESNLTDRMRFATIEAERLTEIAAVGESLSRLDALFTCLQHRAFRGEL